MESRTSPLNTIQRQLNRRIFLLNWSTFVAFKNVLITKRSDWSQRKKNQQPEIIKKSSPKCLKSCLQQLNLSSLNSRNIINVRWQIIGNFNKTRNETDKTLIRKYLIGFWEMNWRFGSEIIDVEERLLCKWGFSL